MLKLIVDVLAFVSVEAVLERALRATKAGWRLARRKISSRKVRLNVEKEIAKIDAKDWLL